MVVGFQLALTGENAQFPHTSSPKPWRLPQFLGVTFFVGIEQSLLPESNPFPNQWNHHILVIDTISKYVHDGVFKYCTNILYSLFVNVFQLYVHPSSYTGQPQGRLSMCFVVLTNANEAPFVTILLNNIEWQLILRFFQVYVVTSLGECRVEVPAGLKNKGWIASTSHLNWEGMTWTDLDPQKHLQVVHYESLNVREIFGVWISSDKHVGHVIRPLCFEVAELHVYACSTEWWARMTNHFPYSITTIEKKHTVAAFFLDNCDGHAYNHIVITVQPFFTLTQMCAKYSLDFLKRNLFCTWIKSKRMVCEKIPSTNKYL